MFFLSLPLPLPAKVLLQRGRIKQARKPPGTAFGRTEREVNWTACPSAKPKPQAGGGIVDLEEPDTPENKKKEQTLPNGNSTIEGGRKGIKVFEEENIQATALSVELLPVVTRTVKQRMWTGSQLIVFGGDDTSHIFNKAERYDEENDSWMPIPSMLTESEDGTVKGKNGFGVTVLNGEAYAISGSNAETWLTTVEKYDPRLGQWSFVKDVHMPRFGCTAATMDGHIYVIGGHNGNFGLNSVERYDPKKDEWAYVAPMNLQRSYAASIVLRGHLYVIAGTDVTQADKSTCATFKSIEWYDKKKNKWLLLDRPLQIARSFASAAVYKHVIYVFGGEGCAARGRDNFHKSVEKLDTHSVR